jgi:hypothetical protein
LVCAGGARDEADYFDCIMLVEEVSEGWAMDKFDW